MRIRDWSSDVCSSDLDSVAIKTKKKGPVVVVESGNGLRPSDDLREMLDYSSADDRLVGIVHRYCGDNPGKEVRLLSHDTGPLLTAKRVAVPFVRVPERSAECRGGHECVRTVRSRGSPDH